MAKDDAVQLGDRVKDPVTGHQGIAVCITTWLHGCIRVGVQGEKIGKDAKVPDPVYFDQSQLKIMKKRVHAPKILDVVEAPPAPKRQSPGGPAREGGNFVRHLSFVTPAKRPT